MRKKLLVTLAAATILSSTLAIAVEKNIATLPKIEVTASKNSITAGGIAKAQEKIKSIPGAAVVVDAKEFENTRTVTIKDMLDYVAGVFAQPRFSEEVRLSIRGSGLSRTFHLRGIKLLQDGVPINLADGSGDFQDIDPTAFKYVEVYKGANALKYGAASLGGAINFVTPTGYDAAKLAGRIDFGSFGTIREQVSSGQVIGNSDYFITGSNIHSDGYRDHSTQDNTRFASNFGHKFSDSLETRFYLSYADVNSEIPGNLTKAQLESDSRKANSTNENMNYQRDFSVYRIANKTTWQGDALVINGGVYTLQKDLYHPIFQLIDQENSDYGIFGDTTISGYLAGKRNELTIGTNLSLGQNDTKQYVNNEGNYGSLTNENNQKSKNADLYFEDQFYVKDNLAIIAGSQLTYASRNYKDEFFSDGDRSGEKKYYGISPKIGALYSIRPDIQLFTNLSSAYEPPTFSELTQSIPGFSGLADIEAQESTTFEVGTRGNEGRFNWDASIYHAKINNELMTYSLGGSSSGILNADSTIHQGLELSLGALLLENIVAKNDLLTIRTSYSYNDFKFDGDNSWGDNQIPGAPKHYIRSELRYKEKSGFYISPNIEVVPEGYAVDMANTLYTDSYMLLGLQTGYEINKNITFYVDARNLTDKTYAATTGVITRATASNTAQFVPGDGRAFYTGLSFKW
jgi:iron complex outermembrane receptor protein